MCLMIRSIPLLTAANPIPAANPNPNLALYGVRKPRSCLKGPQLVGNFSEKDVVFKILEYPALKWVHK